MKHAFIVMCHTNFNQVSKLLKQLDSMGEFIVIGIDRNSHSVEVRDELCSSVKNAAVQYLPQIQNWGGVFND